MVIAYTCISRNENCSVEELSRSGMKLLLKLHVYCFFAGNGCRSKSTNPLSVDLTLMAQHAMNINKTAFLLVC